MTSQQLEDRIKELERLLIAQTSVEKRDRLSEIEELIKIHTNNSFDVIFTLNEEGAFIYISPAWNRLFGYSSEEALGQKFAKFVHPDDVASLFAYFSSLISTQQSATSPTYRVRHANGKWSWFIANCTYHTTTNGIVQILGVAHDITAQVNAEAIQRETDAKYKEIINQINDAIVVCDDQAKIIIWNKGAEQIFGLKASETINANIVEIQMQLALPQNKDPEHFKNSIDEMVTLSNHEAFNCIMDSQIITANTNEIKDIQGRVFPVKLNNSYLFCSVFRDTTEVKKIEKQLLQLNSDKNRFISILAHDLKSPFNALLGFSELLSSSIQDYSTEEIVDFAFHINKTAHNTFNLLEDILMWAHSQAGKIPFKPQIISLTRICSDVCNLLGPNADNKEITISTCNKEKDFLVYADEEMLKTILRNLISNSIKFTHRGGGIKITASQNQETTTVTVSDNGIGIHPEVMENIFNITHQMNKQGTENEQGTGLGLILCNEFIQKHNGNIWVVSEPGNGSQFSFSLPNFAEAL